MTYNSSRPLRVFEAFAGYGSQHLALKRLKRDFPDFNFKVVGISEIERNAIKAYGIIHGDFPNFGDIAKIDWPSVPDFDLFTWSFPCQDISVAGRMKGAEEGSGTRSALGWVAVSAIEQKKPKLALMENVKALVGAKHKAVFDAIKSRLEAAGYANYWQVMDASGYGVPQHRERVFMLSILRSADVSPCKFEFPQPFPLKVRLKDVLQPVGSVPEKYYLPEEKVDKMLASAVQKGVSEKKIKALACLFEQDSDTERVIQVGNTTEGAKRDNPNAGRVYAPNGISPCINTCGGGNLQPQIIEAKVMQIGNAMDDSARAFKNPERTRVYAAEGCSPTLKATMADRLILEPTAVVLRGRGEPTEQRLELGDNVANCLTSVQKDSLVAVPEQLAFRIRKLTPRECFRLMDVDDDRIDQIQAAGISNSQQYKLAGNSIVVSCLYHLFRKMFVDADTPANQPTQLTIFDI